MHTKYLKELILHAWNTPRALNLFSLIIGSLTFLYLFFLCYSWVISHKHFTLKNVVLEVVNNDNPNLDTQEIQQVIKTTLNGTTLSTDLKMMVELILDNPWVEQVVIRRVWPNTIVLRLQELRIIALWNNRYLVSESGEMTNIPVSDYKKLEKKLGCYLIKLEGPKDFLAKIVARAEITNKLLTNINKKLLHLRLTEQFSWEAKTTEGLTLRFGGDDLQGPMYYRLENFTKSYSKLANELAEKGTRSPEIHHVDLRYAKGFAIKIKNKKNKPLSDDNKSAMFNEIQGVRLKMIVKEKESFFAGLDIGTSKIVTVIARTDEEENIEIVGLGESESIGLKRGVINNIDATVESIKKSIEEAELMAGYKIKTVWTGIAGSHIRSLTLLGWWRLEIKRFPNLI